MANSPGKTPDSEPGDRRDDRPVAADRETADDHDAADPVKARVDAAWERLPEHVRQTILTIVEAHDSGCQASDGG